jgi:hypothetical protein
MGLFSAIGSLFGGGSAKKASRRAEAAQLEYLNRALEEQRRQYDTTRTDFEPFRGAGVDALGDQRALLGLDGPEAQAAAMEALRGSPLFETIYDTGEEAVLQNAAATGGIRGGNTQRSLADFGADTFTTTLLNQLQQLGGISGMGLQATGGTAQSGDNITQAIANIIGQQGQVRAGGLLTRGGISNSMWNNVGGALDSAVSSIFGGVPGLGKLF